MKKVYSLFGRVYVDINSQKKLNWINKTDIALIVLKSLPYIALNHTLITITIDRVVEVHYENTRITKKGKEDTYAFIWQLFLLLLSLYFLLPIIPIMLPDKQYIPKIHSLSATYFTDMANHFDEIKEYIRKWSKKR